MLATQPKKPSAVERVVGCITDEIINGELKPGSQLLTEPELSQKYGVGRNTVREAIKQLQAFGILYIRRPDGTFVTESYDQKMLDPMLYSLILKNRDWQDFVQLRAVIDMGTLHVAMTEPRLEEIFPRLEAIIAASAEELHKPQPSVTRILELDLEFHQTIAAVIHNPQVDSVTSYITRLTVPSRRATVRRWLDDGQTELFLELHRQILEVLRTRNKSRIEEVVGAHYVYWKK